MSNNKSNLIKVAFVPYPHGIRGDAEVRLLNLDPNDSLLEEGLKVWLFPSNEKSQLSTKGEEWLLKKLRFGNKIIATFEGIKDRTHLETLIPFEIFVDRAELPEPEEDDFYLFDLLEAKVCNREGEEVGILESFDDNGMQYLFNIRLKTGELVTLPYVEAFFPEVDVENKKLTMIFPEYTE